MPSRENYETGHNLIDKDFDFLQDCERFDFVQFGLASLRF